ncbi:MAG: hypothetical protein ACPGSB_02570 [Opitutales bacterium]
MDAETLAQLAGSQAEETVTLDDTERSLWLAKIGRWEDAHDLCQTLPDPAGSWIHAWLHREEGDYGNACYWYRRAGKSPKPESASLEDEWFEIAKSLLD